MKKRKWIIAVVIVAIVVIAILGVVFYKTGNISSSDGTESTQTGSSEEEAVSSEERTGSVSDESGLITDEIQGEVDEDTVTASDVIGGDMVENSGGTTAEKGQIISGDSITTMGFPYTDESEGVVIEAVYSYSGYYLEDGSDEEISNVAMLEVTNISEEVIEYGTVSLTADGEDLQFHISLVPAGATVLVMEADKKGCSESADCSYGGCEIAYAATYGMCEDQVTIENNGSGALTVTNISSSDIAELHVFYKNQMDTAEYVGGISYTFKLEDLAAGESMTVYPSHFDPEYGVVMMVRIYD